MTDATKDTDAPEGFSEYRALHPDFFPVESPIERQYAFYNSMKEREIQHDNELEMAKLSKIVTSESEEKERLREYAAIKALSEPLPMGKFIDAFKVSHVGHYQILRAIIYAECLKSSGTTKGLQPAVTGNRGSGKSHAVKTAVHLLPKDAIYTATLSPKALYYKNPERKTSFYLDDAELDKDLISFMKRKQTQFQEPTTYGIVIDKKWVEKSVEKRMVFITTSVAALGDEQLTDRALLIDIKNETTDDAVFYEFENERRSKGLPEFPENEDVLLCRDMLSHIRNQEFRVILPSLDFAYYGDRRLIGMTYDLMEASAILHYRQREHQDDHGILVVTANEEDLANALDFDMFTNSDSVSLSRLSKSERAFDLKVQGLLGLMDGSKYTEKDLAIKTGMSVPGIRNYLYGRDNSAATIKDGSGLCGKTTWYMIDSEKDLSTESVKNYVVVTKHIYQNQSFAWVKEINTNINGGE